MLVEVAAELRLADASLTATVRLSEFPTGWWWLHDGLAVTSCRLDGTPCGVDRLFSEPAAPFSPRVHPVSLARTGSVLELALAGAIANREADVNVIGPDLAELAVYAAWLPVFPDLPLFDFTLDLSVDGAHHVAVNGASGGEHDWANVVPCFDITVIATPNAKHTRRAELPVTVLAPAGVGDMADTVLEEAGAAIDACRRWWGPPHGRVDEIVVALSPRDGWAYSRLPLIVLPAAAGVDDGAVHTLRHEIGHLWWSAAPFDGGHDWLNEGIAEYAAWRLAPEPDVTRRRALEDLGTSGGDPPVGQETQPAGSRHRNLYLRPALAFAALEARHGADALDRTLRGFLDPTRRTSGPLTTTVALEVVGRQLGSTSAAHLAEMLTTPGWMPQP